MKQVTVATLLALCAWPTLAHDMWLQPAHFAGETGQPVEPRLFIGEKLEPEEQRPLGRDRAYRFQFFDEGKTVNLDQSVSFPVGSGVLVMERIPAFIELEAEKFNTYLEEEGHYDVIRQRLAAGTYGKRARERYTRHLKTILAGSDPWPVASGRSAEDTRTDHGPQTTGHARTDQDHAHIFGMMLELVPQTDPRNIQPGESFDILVLFQEKPLAGARLGVYAKGAREKLTRTDQQGRARFTIEGHGVVLVRTTLIRPCSHCDDADYESFWAALTFEVK